jgi:flavodoxin/formate hydrogenlyase subunit 6/NADH:ubiquinone oxidoreductase subunit I
MEKESMKSIVIYYSATGSTKKVAKAIHKGMKDSMEVCDIAPIKKVNPKDLVKYDLIAIGAPIWYFREPANVRLFIYNMPDLKGKLCVPFCSHGASPAGIFFTMVPLLVKRGLTIIGWNDWYGSVHMVLHQPKPYMTDGHPDEIDLKEAEDFGHEMAERARRIAAGETNLIPKLPKGKNIDPLWQPHPMGGGAFNMAPPQRRINMEKCTYPKCTICVDICPMNSIDFSKSHPVFRKNCLDESVCERLCPNNAIEVDEVTADRRVHRVINMEKCKYPKCTLCIDHCAMNAIDFSTDPPSFKHTCDGGDLCWVICPEGAIEITNLEKNHAMMGRHMDADTHPFVKLLKEEAAKGRFRWLVPLEKVGWDNPIWKNPNHPRYVVEDD